jgi:hypothetical protein
MAMNATDQRETGDLMASDKVEGTNVHRSNGESVGERLGGYEMNVSEQELQDAPNFGSREEWDWNDQHVSELNTHHGVRASGKSPRPTNRPVRQSSRFVLLRCLVGTVRKSRRAYNRMRGIEDSEHRSGYTARLR